MRLIRHRWRFAVGAFGLKNRSLLNVAVTISIVGLVVMTGCGETSACPACESPHPPFPTHTPARTWSPCRDTVSVDSVVLGNKVRWSPDGSSIYFHYANPNSAVYSVISGGSGLTVIERTGQFDLESKSKSGAELASLDISATKGNLLFTSCFEEDVRGPRDEFLALSHHYGFELVVRSSDGAFRRRLTWD